MNVYRGVLVMLALAPWAAQAHAQTAATASGAPAGQQQASAAPGPQTPAQSGQQGGAPGSTQGAHGRLGGQGLRPQPAIIVDANALIREGQRANAAEEAQSAPPPRLNTPAKKKPGVHLSTSRPLPLSTEDAGKP
jgi:hypothetical protein